VSEKSTKKTTKAKASAKTNKKKSKSIPTAQIEALPGFLQAFLAGSQLIVLMVGLLVFILASISGATALTIAFRTGVSILATGIVTWLISWRVMRGSIDAIYEMKEAAIEESKKKIESSVEKQV
jgi:hypothetical protein